VKLVKPVKLVLALVAVAFVVSIPACSAPDDSALMRKPSKARATDAGTADNADPTGDDVPDGVEPGTGAGTGPGTSGTPGADAGAGTAVTSSKGTGGATGQNELTSTGGLSYIINVPATAPAKPRGVLVLLHGSTASNYREFIGMMATVASTYDLIRVSVLAPNGQGWNEGNQTNAAELLHKLVQQDLLPKYDIDLSRVLFSGQSSGGGFLSSYFLPLHAKDYRGGAFLQCGAAPPVPTFAPDAATKQGFRLHFEITTGDTIWPASYKNAVSAYTAAGMTLTKDDTKPGGHCAFDQQAVIQAHIATILP
jgi:predicted esterase